MMYSYRLRFRSFLPYGLVDPRAEEVRLNRQGIQAVEVVHQKKLTRLLLLLPFTSLFNPPLFSYNKLRDT